MCVHDMVEVFNIYKTIRMPVVYKELSAITVLEHKFDLHLIISKDPMEQALLGYDIFGDVEAIKMVHILDVASIFTRNIEFEPLNKPLCLSPRASIEETPKLELKSLLSHLKYTFLSDNDTLSIILSTGLSDV